MDLCGVAASPIRPFAVSPTRLLVTGYWLLVTGYWLLVTGYWCLGRPGAGLSQGFYEVRDDSRLKSVLLPDSPKRYPNRFGRHQISKNNLTGWKLCDRFADKRDTKASGHKGECAPNPVRLPHNPG